MKLWSRQAPAPAEDAFFGAPFAETRRYVAQVLASYERYREWPAEPASRQRRMRAELVRETLLPASAS